MHNVTDDAVGLSHSENSPKEPKNWFIALVRHNSEKTLRDLFSSKGVETYVATQQRLRVSPSGRKKWVERVILPSKVFIKCSEKQRLEIVNNPYIYRFMMDPSSKDEKGFRKVAVVPDNEIKTLMYMLNQSDYPVDFIETCYKLNDSVRIIRGSLKGLEGKVLESSETNKDVILHLDILGSARISIPASDLQLI